jgi:hypothetical protein
MSNYSNDYHYEDTEEDYQRWLEESETEDSELAREWFFLDESERAKWLKEHEDDEW